MSLTTEELEKDLKMLNERKDKCLQDFFNVTGAISILEQLIFRTINRSKKENHINESNNKIHNIPLDNKQNFENESKN